MTKTKTKNAIYIYVYIKYSLFIMTKKEEHKSRNWKINWINDVIKAKQNLKVTFN